MLAGQPILTVEFQAKERPYLKTTARWIAPEEETATNTFIHTCAQTCAPTHINRHMCAHRSLQPASCASASALAEDLAMKSPRD